MQVGRKVAQVLESLGRSAETIQEAEVEFLVLVITNVIAANTQNKCLNISHSSLPLTPLFLLR